VDECSLTTAIKSTARASESPQSAFFIEKENCQRPLATIRTSAALVSRISSTFLTATSSNFIAIHWQLSLIKIRHHELVRFPRPLVSASRRVPAASVRLAAEADRSLPSVIDRICTTVVCRQ
jgi:hypothetical protein